MFRRNALLTSGRVGAEQGLSARQAGNALGNLGIDGPDQRRRLRPAVHRGRCGSDLVGRGSIGATLGLATGLGVVGVYYLTA
jgi:hypothetical protein